MFTELKSHIIKSRVYAESTSSMWNDEHISKQMLDVHLNPEIDAASRKHEFIMKSVDWINSKIKSNSKILDLGCGPGLYATQLCRKGHEITGLDISENSIKYAIKNSDKDNLSINYKCENYLEIDYQNEFDVVLLIYCDFGVLSIENQKLILQKIYRSLKSNGIFIFDVMSHQYFSNFQEAKSWKFEDAGFWRSSPHLILEEQVKYLSEKVILEKFHIIEDNRIECYQNWNKCFDTNEIKTLLDEHGFSVADIYSNVAGNTFNENSDTIAIISNKHD